MIIRMLNIVMNTVFAAMLGWYWNTLHSRGQIWSVQLASGPKAMRPFGYADMILGRGCEADAEGNFQRSNSMNKE